MKKGQRCRELGQALLDLRGVDACDFKLVAMQSGLVVGRGSGLDALLRAVGRHTALADAAVLLIAIDCGDIYTERSSFRRTLQFVSSHLQIVDSTLDFSVFPDRIFTLRLITCKS